MDTFFNSILSFLPGMIPFVIFGIIAGKITNNILHRKGHYSKDWFWFGFLIEVVPGIFLGNFSNPLYIMSCLFLGLIPIIIAALMPKVDLEMREQQRKIGEEALLKNNGWRCKKCGTVNVESARACSCCRTPKPAEDGEAK